MLIMGSIEQIYCNDVIIKEAAEEFRQSLFRFVMQFYF